MSLWKTFRFQLTALFKEHGQSDAQSPCDLLGRHKSRFYWEAQWSVGGRHRIGAHLSFSFLINAFQHQPVAEVLGHLLDGHAWHPPLLHFAEIFRTQQQSAAV
jgi:hypothetical protein